MIQRPGIFFLPSIVTLFALSTAMAAAAAQSPTQTTMPPTDVPASQQSRPHRPRPKPVNLQVLPKDFTGDQVIDVMHKFERELGVECEYCHAKNPTPSPTTGHLDFASDTNPMKDRARVMMRMNQDINQQFLAQLKSPAAEHEVTCGTCHRGNAKPAVFVPAPEEHHPEGAPPPGPASAATTPGATLPH